MAKSQENARVLLVGERASGHGVAKRALEERGVAVRVAADLVEALSDLSRQTPEVMVVGAVTAESAFDLVRRIREAAGKAHVALIAVTSFAPPDSLVAAGFDDVVPPQLDAGTMARVIEAHLPRAKSEVPPSDIAAAARTLDQLERQVLLSADLARRCALLTAEITILGRISDSVLRGEAICTTIQEGLAACCEAGGAATGILYEREGDKLVPRNAHGAIEASGLASFFGELPLLERIVAAGRMHGFRSAGAALEEARVLDAADASSALVAPLSTTVGEAGIGAVVIFGRARSVDADTEWLAFVQGVTRQLAHGIALQRSFAAKAAAERASDASRGEWQALVDSVPDIVMRLDAHGTVELVNRPPPGMQEADVLGHPLPALAQPHDREAVAASLARVLEGGESAHVEIEGFGGSGNKRVYACTIGRVGQGPRPGAVVVARDITQKRATENQLLSADRMASLGTLAAAVAHEINSPLASIIANLDLVEHETSTRDWPFTPELRDARQAAERVAAIVHNLEVYSQSDVDDSRAEVDLRACLEAAIRLAGNEIRHRARLVFDYRDAPKVLANPSRLSQVFLGILVNAVQAIEPGKADSNEVRVTLRTAPDGNATVRVGDTGSGIPARIQPLLFVPFVSTRKTGESSGLSLAIAQRVVTSIGGRIEWKTEAGRGTEITISLPPAPAASPPAQGELPGLAPRAKERGRVLVVDDEPLIARAVARTLREHDVVTTTSGVEAFELIEHGERFDVVVCDLMMPQMTGMDLFDKLLAFAPEQAERFIFLSGGAFTVQAREFLERVKNPRMDKPFETHALRALVRERLNR